MPADPPKNFLIEPTPYAEAVKWLQDKPVVSREVFDSLLPELRGRAFTVTGVEDANVVAEVRSIVAELPAGMPWDESKKLIAAKLGPWLGEDDDGGASALARAETLLRTHGFGAYRTAAHEVMVRQSDIFEYWQMLTLDDEKVRPSHRAWHEVIAPADSPFWADKPGGWGCRCRKVPLLKEEADEIVAEDATKPLEERRFLEGSRLQKATEGRLIRGVRDGNGKLVRDATLEWNVANPDLIGSPTDLRLNLATLKDRYDAETWGEFEAKAKAGKLEDGRTVWEWLSGVEASPGAEAPKVAPAAVAGIGGSLA